jgi:hypothetical protein
MSNRPIKSEKQPRRHPLFGFMKGTLWVAPGVDLTEPACPEWDELIEEKLARIEEMLNAAKKDEKT